MAAPNSYQGVSQLFIEHHWHVNGEGRAPGTAGKANDLSLEREFLLSLVVDPEFFSTVRKRMPAAERAAWIEELGFTLIMELLLPPETSNLDKAVRPNQSLLRLVPQERLDEIHKLYPEVFLEETAEGSGHQASGSIIPPVYLKTAQAVFQDRYVSEKEVLAAKCTHGNLRSIDPQDMASLLAFFLKMQEGIEGLLKVFPNEPQLRREILPAIGEGKEGMEMIFWTAWFGTGLRWFRGLEEKSKEDLWSTALGLDLAPDAAEKAVSEAMEWGSELAYLERVILGAEAYLSYDEDEMALGLYENLLEKVDLSDERTAELHNRIGVIHRAGERTRKALIEFQEASIIWERLGRRYEQGINAALISEGYLTLGKLDKARAYLDESRTALLSLEEEPRKTAFGLMHLANCARSLGDQRTEMLALEKALLLAGNEDADMLLEINARLLALA